MQNFRTSLTHSLCLLALASAFVVPLAHADEYTDINQLLRSGKSAEALSKAEQYLAGKPKDPQMRFLKGVAQTENGKTAEAIATFTKITEDYPELPEPYNNLAVLYANNNQFDKARAALEMAIRTNPSYATAHENLGDVYAKLASQAYGKALQLDGTNTAVKPKLALIRDLFSANAKGGAQKTVPTTNATVTGSVTPISKPAVVAVQTDTSVPAAKPAASATVVATTAVATAVVAPAAIAPSVPAIAPAAAPSQDTKNEVEAAVRTWAAAWSAKDIDGYLASYGKEFDTPGKQSRKGWEAERRSRISEKTRIKVTVSNLNIKVDGNNAVVRFRQDYSADTLNISGRKALELAKTGGRWVIVKETSGA